MKRLIFFFFFFSLTLAHFGESSIIKKPPKKPQQIKYQDLVCTEQDQNNIYQIISTMGEKGKLSLLFQQSHLRELGAQINHVHPLKFLAAIFKNAHLRSCMPIIWNDYFKRNGFLDGLAPSLSREAEKGKLHEYLKDFASDIGVQAEQIRPYFDARDWENLVLQLIHLTYYSDQGAQ